MMCRNLLFSIMMLASLSACVLVSKPYVYTPLTPNEVPATIENSAEFTSNQKTWLGFPVMHISLFINKINHQFWRTGLPPLEKDPNQVTEYKLNPGKNTLSFYTAGAMNGMRISGDTDIDIVLDAVSGMHYTIGITDESGTGLWAYAIWIKDSSGNIVAISHQVLHPA